MIHDHDQERYLPPLPPCPTCGRPWPPLNVCAPFEPRISGLLDLVLIAKDALTEVQAALEEEAL